MHINARGALVAAAALLAGAGSATAAPLASLVPGLHGAELAKVVSGESLVVDAKTASGLRLAPAGSEGDAIKAHAAAESARILIECAYLLPGKHLAGEAKLGAFNALIAVRSLSGLSYDSFTRKKETVLLSDVFRVSGPLSREALPDQTRTSLPAEASLDFHARDVNFGSTWYELTIKPTESGFLLTLTNTTPQGLYLVRAFDSGDLKLFFAIVNTDEGVYFYGTCAATPTKAAEAMADMFSAARKRLEALRSWTAGRIMAGS